MNTTVGIGVINECVVASTPLDPDKLLASGNVAFAFGLTIGAGLCTTIGAMLPFCIKVQSPRVLAVALASSAGLRQLCRDFRQKSRRVDSARECWRTVCAVGGHALFVCCELVQFSSSNKSVQGIVLMFFLDLLVHRLDPSHSHQLALVDDLSGREAQVSVDDFLTVSHESEPSDSDSLRSCHSEEDEDDDRFHENSVAARSMTDVLADITHADSKHILQSDAEKRRLKRMGLMTALAIGVHNLPEGLATFVGALADSRLGIGLAVAIAVHNVPEGICVAVPILYATNSKWKAFAWAFLSGISEPIGATLGYLFLATFLSNALFGIIFGLVSGMMIYISLKELLPTAHAYDSTDKYVTVSFVIGMFVIAISLILFTF